MSMHESSNGDTRSSALWGKRTGVQPRVSGVRNVGWKGGRIALAALTATLSLVVVGPGFAGQPANSDAYVPSSLLADAQAHPDQLFQVIVQGDGSVSSKDVGKAVDKNHGKSRNRFQSITGVSAEVSGKDLVKLARFPHVSAITPDASLKQTSYQNAEMWRQTVRIDTLWNTTDPLTGAILGPAPQAPAIAIVDSGVDTSRLADFGSRVVAAVNLSSLSPLVAGDEEGHGTMVAGIAAGASVAYPGVARNAPIVSIKTADAKGESRTSDVITATDWILSHKQQYNIRVANFSLAGTTDTSFRFDPLDKAVEKLWFNGVVVVAAAGNFGTGGGVSMGKAPGNDPFIITVGATDENQTTDPLDDRIPSWSAYGYTPDGFSKPDMVAPGRYMIMPVPAASTIPATVPDRVVKSGYMWMSGTSFSAPIVAGAAAQILARHPDWGADEVKGALMLGSVYLSNDNWQAAGVGEVDAAAAASIDFLPPNPNENLYAFVSADPTTGQRTFDQASWATKVASDASWAQASWAQASWATASWAQASWAQNVDSMLTPALSLNEATYNEATFVE